MGRQIAIIFVVLLFFGTALDLFIGHQKAISQATATPTPSATTRATATPSPSATPKPTPRPSYVPTPPPPTVRVSGWGTGNSRVFALGDSLGYDIGYSLPGSCQYYGELRTTDGSYDNTDFIQDSGPTSVTKIINYALSGNYYVAMNARAGCYWSIVFTPR